MTQTVTALYDTYNFAVSAVNALEASGVPHSDISIVSNNVDNRYTKDRPTHAAEDVAKGAGIGAAVGGVGSLTGAGVPERDAQFYAEGVRRGGTFVTARVNDARASTAREILQRYKSVTRSSVARHMAKAAGRPSTKTRRLTLRTKSQRSAHATSDNAASS
jgi:hypothetical protein